jgi:hypothetical protein
MGGSDGMLMDTPPTEKEKILFIYRQYIIMEHTDIHTESLIGVETIWHCTTEPSSW